MTNVRESKAQSSETGVPHISFKSFLEETPPDTSIKIEDLEWLTTTQISPPVLDLYCSGDACGGIRRFTSGSFYVPDTWAVRILEYTCSNCRIRVKRYAIFALFPKYASTDSKIASARKLGEFPPFGPQTPTRLITLIGPDRELFLQGRRAESRGFGIGAFAYYRRVVENQKNRIIGEIARVAKVVGSTKEVDDLFAAAMKETRFKESIDLIRDSLPQTLLINGQNPLTLLHTALSKGLHDPDMSDARCLTLATAIRTILAELAERASEALKNDKEIQAALTLLMSKNS